MHLSYELRTPPSYSPESRPGILQNVGPLSARIEARYPLDRYARCPLDRYAGTYWNAMPSTLSSVICGTLWAILSATAGTHTAPTSHTGLTSHTAPTSHTALTSHISPTKFIHIKCLYPPNLSHHQTASTASSHPGRWLAAAALPRPGARDYGLSESGKSLLCPKRIFCWMRFGSSFCSLSKKYIFL